MTLFDLPTWAVAAGGAVYLICLVIIIYNILSRKET